MQTLDDRAFGRARDFLLAHPHPLHRARFRFHFEGGSRDEVRAALAPYANPDGGFGHGIEPDFQLPDSSPMATSWAFHFLREIDAGDDDPLVRGAVDYLVRTWDPGRPGWEDVPKAVNDHPHAPWWQREGGGASAEWGNPDADIIAALHEHAALVPAHLLDELLALAMERLETTPAPCPRYIALCYLELARAAPPEAGVRIVERLREDSRHILDLDPAVVTAQEFQVWWLAESPDSPLAEPLGAEIAWNLDAEIERQHESGCWAPRWSWGPAYPEAWERARHELQASETLRTLLVLRAWGRIRGR
jgi:hypothetical protein